MENFYFNNKLGFLSLLSLLGIIGIVTDNRGYLGFWGYLYYIRYFFVIPDELFRANVQKAAVPAFFSGLSSTAGTIILKFVTNSNTIIPMGMGMSMALSLLVFTSILIGYEVKENVGTRI